MTILLLLLLLYIDLMITILEIYFTRRQVNITRKLYHYLVGLRIRIYRLL